MDAQPRRRRWPYLVLAYSCVGLGSAGVVLPGLPTTPFLLVAVWAASRGSEKLHRQLYEHRHFGPLLRHWQTQRAVPRRAKWVAVLLLALSWSVLAWRSAGPLPPLITGVFFLAVAGFLISRPEPRELDEERHAG